MAAPVASRPPRSARPASGAGRADGRRNRARLLAAAGEELQRGQQFTLADVARARADSRPQRPTGTSAPPRRWSRPTSAGSGTTWTPALSAIAADDFPALLPRVGRRRARMGPRPGLPAKPRRLPGPTRRGRPRGSADCSRSSNRGSRPSCARPGRAARPSSATCWPSGTRWPTRGRFSTSARPSAGRQPGCRTTCAGRVRAAIRR